MHKQQNSIQATWTQAGAAFIDHLVACAAACLLAAVMALSTSPAMAQGTVGDFKLPTTIPGLSELAAITPANFLAEVQNLVRTSNARDLVALGKQAAGVALHIEELQISFLQKALCNAGPVAAQIPAQYSQEVQLGCSLIGAQAELNRIKQKALALIGP